jgi:asparagine synthase (glutamine-hydrolysing)
MCGLTSAFYPDGVTPPSVEALQRGLDASLETIKHRGPDSRGTYVSPDGRVGAYILHWNAIFSYT